MNPNTPPPIPPQYQSQSQTPPPYQGQPVIDPLFVGKSEAQILDGIIDRELTASGFDVKNDSLTHFEKKK